MPLDLNNAPTQEEARARYGGGNLVDLDAIEARLRDHADVWLPRLFPNGWRDGDDWVTGDINDKRATKNGSCRFGVRGPHAGDWYDWAERRGGGVFSTIKSRLGLGPGEVIREASRILEECGVAVERIEGERPKRAPRASRAADHTNDAAHEWKKGGLLAGTRGERYIYRRGGRMPPTDDLRFSTDCVRFYSTGVAVGQDAIIARFRYPDGTPSGGIHRIFLKPDGSGHDGKKMLGPVDGAVVMLAPPDAKGRLGVAEGIETTAAAMQMYGVPGWAAASDNGLKKFAEWLAANPDAVRQAGIKRLLIWSDAGKAGVSAGRQLRDVARQAGLDAYLLLPRGGDDFADDLAQGLSPSEPVTDAEPAAEASVSEVLPSQEEVKAAIETLTTESDPTAIRAVIEKIAAARLGRLWDDPFLATLKERTGRMLPALSVELREAKKRLEASSQARPKQQAVATIDWRASMHLNDKREPKLIVSNVFLAATNDKAWTGVVALNDFTGMITLRAQPPWPEPNFKPRPWTDEDTRMATLWMQDIAGIHAFSNIVFEGIATAAERNRYHPVRDFFGSLKWDSTPRLETWLSYYLGCDDNQYVRAIGPRWLISAVARIYEPGCKADCCLILEGDQGIGKSTAFKTLAGDDWFTDEIADLGSKDAAMQTRGKLIIELAELDALGKAEVSRQKIYMSRTSDRFRPPYGKVMIEVPRQFVFAGSVNDNQYLRDPTGGRRFWGVWCKSIEIDALAHDRDQLWAEACAKYALRARWYLDTPELIALAKQEQADRYQADAWESPITEWLSGELRLSVTVADVMANALEIRDKSKWTRADQMRVGSCLKHLGWDRQRVRVGGVLEWRYTRPIVPTVPT